MIHGDVNVRRGVRARAFLPVAAGALLVLGAVQFLGCGDDDDVGAPEPDAGPDAAMDGGSGGAGTGGTDAGGGSGGSADSDAAVGGDGGSPGAGSGGSGGTGGADGGCVYTGDPVDVSAFEECTLCENAHCVPSNAVQPDLLDRLADCEDGENKCVPDMYIEMMGAFILESCTSIGGAEGRCVSVCIPEVEEQQDVLPQDDCEDDERCAPCFDPVTGEDTGSCSISCDTGPTEDAYTFDECCDGISVCVPTELVAESDREGLDEDVCTGDDELCVPKEMAMDPSGYTPETCASWDGAEGRCLPACLPDVDWNAPRIEQHGCPEGFLCAPCFDHVTGEEMDSCHVAGDPGPTEDPVIFPKCCGGLSVCVPEEAISDEDAARLDADTCEEDDVLCVPEGMALAPTRWVPDKCKSWNGAEGRCLPACLPDVAAEADMLDQGTCVEEDCDCETEGYLCAPCYHPITGEDTDACRLTPADEPQDTTPYTFSECCDGLSLCIPEALVDEDQSDLLDADTCTEETAHLCVPKPLAEDPTGWIPDECDSWNGAEGRCLPACLPDVDEMADSLTQGSCDDDYLCVPCFDPVTGDPTGSCELNGDEPQEDSYTFPECCGEISLCIPNDLVDYDQRDLVGADTCTGDNSCVPKPLAEDPTGWIPEDCDSWNGSEGRCLPACLPDVDEMADSLDRGTCDEGYLCVPCFDPLTGDPTGSCELNGDEPQEGAYTFSECCGGLSLCIPEALIDIPEPGDMLGVDTCTESGNLCVPKTLVDEPTTWVPDACRSWNNIEGRCLPACLPDVAIRTNMLGYYDCDPPEAECDCDDTDAFTCVPCYDPLGTPTGACAITPEDAPVDEAFDYPECCSVDGTCIPTGMVGAQAYYLTDGDCGAQGPQEPADEVWICAPNERIADPLFEFKPCTTTLGGAEGACMRTCHISDLFAIILGPGTCEQADGGVGDCCEAGTLCVPCIDTILQPGTETGACPPAPPAE